jgi:aminopeptidase N
VTCKDWANLWLNEGFATYFEHFWMEQHYGPDDAAYEFWREQGQWFLEKQMYPVPIVNRNFDDSEQYQDNIYTKGGWVLRMLRATLGDDNFFGALHNYLETNRGKNVVTADLVKAIEQSTSIDVDEFFHQWVYRAGAPEYEVSYAYDAPARQLKLEVHQRQKVEGLVGLFDVTIDVEVATIDGRKTYPVRVSEASQSFTFPVDSPPLMVLFDKGDQVLKTLEFKKGPAELIYQSKNAETVPDRADAVVALGNLKDYPEAIAALGDRAQHDPFWGIRVEALRALGKVEGSPAEQEVLAAVSDEKPWVRSFAVEQLGHFKQDRSLAPKLLDIAANDKAYRVRAAALDSLAAIQAPDAYDILVAAVKSDSPDDTLRNAGLEGLGKLGDDRAVPLLLEWSAPGKSYRSRQDAMMAVARLDKKNKDITKTLVSYLRDPYFDVNFWVLYALGERGDPEALGPLEELLKSGDFSLGEKSVIVSQITALRGKTDSK